VCLTAWDYSSANLLLGQMATGELSLCPSLVTGVAGGQGCRRQAEERMVSAVVVVNAEAGDGLHVFL